MMRFIKRTLSLAALTTALATTTASAHFQLIWLDGMLRNPNQETPMALVFTHVFSGGPTMEMPLPEAFFYLHQRGDAPLQNVDLMPYLTPMDWSGSDGKEAAAFRADIPKSIMRSLGDYIFALAPTPYFEEGEGKYIQQFTKLVLNIGGLPGIWHQDVGMPAEIRPLDKPYANWRGGVFRGQILSQGAPVPFAEIEVEYLNNQPSIDAGGWVGDAKIEAPRAVLESFSIRADASGTFAIGLPKAGWWGIGALDVEAGATYNGKPLSRDAVIWVEVTDVD